MKKHATIRVSDAMRSPKLFGPYFAGPSWDLWRAVLKAAFAEPMSAVEQHAFHEVAERDPPSKPVREAVFIAGRGAGKDSVASLIASVIAVNFDPRGRLRPGERAIVMLLALDREQAAIAFNYIRGYFEQIPTLAAMVTYVGHDSIELRNGVVVEVHTNSYRSVRGRSLICVICDEIAFWRDERGADPDVEVIGAVSPGLARMPGSLLIMISTTHKRSGLLYERYKKYFGHNDDDVLVTLGSTATFNPTCNQRIIAADIARDPALYRSEYHCIWRDDLSSYIPRELLDAAVDVGVTVRPPQPGTIYHAFCDPSGGMHDSFVAAVAHRQKDDTVMLDALRERLPPFNPSEVVDEIAAFIKQYGCNKITGDKYAAMWVIEAFAKAGIKYIQSERDRSAIYLDALPLFTAGRVRLVDNARMTAQFAALERRTFATGRDRVDHGRSGRDDACNAASGAMALAAAKGGYISDMSWVGVDADPPFAKVEHPYLQAAWNRHVYGIL